MKKKKNEEKVDWIGSNRIDLESSGLEKEGFYATKETLNTQNSSDSSFLPSFLQSHSFIRAGFNLLFAFLLFRL